MQNHQNGWQNAIRKVKITFSETTDFATAPKIQNKTKIKTFK